MLFIYPFLKFKSNKIREIISLESARLSWLMKFITVVNILAILLYIPILNDITGVVDWGVEKANQYEVANRLWFHKYNLLSHINLLATGMLPITIVLSFYLYFVTQRKRWNVALFYTTILLEVFITIAYGNRGSIVVDSCFIFCLVLLFRDYIPKGTIKKLKYAALVVAVPIVLFFITITQSRFSSDLVTSFNLRYAGENFINFNGLMYNQLNGTTNGQAYFTLFSRVFGAESVTYETPMEKWDFIERKTNVRGQYFYTIVGALCFEFGKTGTLVLAVCFTIVASIILRRNTPVSFSQILFYTIGLYLLINGVFVFKFQESTGNFTMIFLIFLMIYLNHGNKKHIKKREIL
jgi:oligosaccharide repeat unit polymerase